MNGYAGLLTSKSQKRENITSKGCVQRFFKESAGHAAGPAALTAGQRRKNGFEMGFFKLVFNKKEIVKV